MSAGSDLLAVDRLTLSYRVGAKKLRGLKDVSLELKRGRILAVVGESGSGKSTLGFAIPRLLPGNAEVEAGEVRFAGNDLTRLGERQMQAIRGARIAMVFQDPLSSLHPCMTIGQQMSDALRAHRRIGTRECRTLAVEMLTSVGLSDPDENFDRFPHQLSGGMRQRVMVATALLLRPDLLIADEPTSALDVVLQGQITELLSSFPKRFGTAILIVTHDLGIADGMADDILVLYAGEVMEYSDAPALISHPLHPYTEALLAVVPSRKDRGRPLPTIPGRVPSADEPIDGCAYAGRCAMTRSVCHGKRPGLTLVGERRARCHIHDPASGWHDAPAMPGSDGATA
ncbi:MAG TPA: ABC transporter ATP-binding protein [Dongiaceae bacterium]|nr:ABC transporter ATP-binding protein [Dongiaceae bacterium]